MNSTTEQPISGRWIDRCARYLADSDAVTLTLSKAEYELLSQSVEHVATGRRWLRPSDEQATELAALRGRIAEAGRQARRRYGLAALSEPAAA